jgi:hypothetical protein
MRMFPPEPSSSVSRVIGATLITHDSALPKPTAKGDRAASKRNGILSTGLVSKGELHMSAVGRSGTLLF